MAPAAQHDIDAMAEDPVLAAAIFGAGLPEAAGRHLRLAARSYKDARSRKRISGGRKRLLPPMRRC